MLERVASELSGRGAGIVAQAELIKRLRGLCLDTTDLGVPVTFARTLMLTLEDRETLARVVLEAAGRGF